MIKEKKDWDLILREYFHSGMTIKGFVHRYNATHPDSPISESNFYIRLRAYRKNKATSGQQPTTEPLQSNPVTIIDLAAIGDKQKPGTAEATRSTSSILKVSLPNGIEISLESDDGISTLTGVLLGVIRGMQ